MTDIVINFDSSEGMFKIYESTSQTLIVSQSLGEGFANLNLFLLQEGKIQKSILEDQDVLYHFDSHTFQEIIKSNMALLKRVQEIPSEFKNSASKFGVSGEKTTFSRGSKNMKTGNFSGFKGTEFGKSYQRFNRK